MSWSTRNETTQHGYQLRHEEIGCAQIQFSAQPCARYRKQRFVRNKHRFANPEHTRALWLTNGMHTLQGTLWGCCQACGWLGKLSMAGLLRGGDKTCCDATYCELTSRGARFGPGNPVTLPDKSPFRWTVAMHLRQMRVTLRFPCTVRQGNAVMPLFNGITRTT
jgi:hypothetical protein